MINAKPRFGLEGERLFDYVSSRYLDANGVMQEFAGEWDLAYVAELLRAGTTIEAAFTSKAAVEQRQLMQDVHQKQVHALNAENAALKLKVAQYEGKTVGGPDNMGKQKPTIAELEKLLEREPDVHVEVQPDGSVITVPVIDKVQQANADFVAGTPPNPPNDKVEQANRDFLGGDGVALNSMSHADLPAGNPLRGLAENATPEEQAAAAEALRKLTTEGKQVG